MHRRSDTMADELTDDRETFAFDISLDRMADIADTVAWFCLLDAQVQGFFSDFHQTLHFRRGLADHIAPARIGHGTVVVHDCIDLDQIAVLQHIFAREAMADFVVDARARRILVSFETDLFADGASCFDARLHKVVDLHRRQTRLDETAQFLMDTSQDCPGLFHSLNFAIRF